MYNLRYELSILLCTFLKFFLFSFFCDWWNHFDAWWNRIEFVTYRLILHHHKRKSHTLTRLTTEPIFWHSQTNISKSLSTVSGYPPKVPFMKWLRHECRTETTAFCTKNVKVFIIETITPNYVCNEMAKSFLIAKIKFHDDLTTQPLIS